jgi:hypothetical protein
MGMALCYTTLTDEHQVLANVPILYNLSTSQTLGGSFFHVDSPYLC